MKFVYDGDYAVKDGVTFMFRNPSEVENHSTIEKLLKDPCFQKVEDEEKAEVPAEEPEPKVKGKPCAKCGRIIRQGWYMHQKYCNALSSRSD